MWNEILDYFKLKFCSAHNPKRHLLGGFRCDNCGVATQDLDDDVDYIFKPEKYDRKSNRIVKKGF